MVQLDTCPLDVLHLIFEYLEYHELGRVGLSGSTTLIKAVYQTPVITQQQRHPRPPRLVPLKCFSQLKQYKLICEAAPPFWISYELPELSGLPSKLSKLRLDFDKAPASLRDRTPGVSRFQYLQLHLMLPELRELVVIGGNWNEIPSSFWVNLPRGLHKLVLRETQRESVILDPHLMFIPPNIQYLALERLVMAYEQSQHTPKKSAIKWPNSLTVLICMSNDLLNVVDNLPIELKVLKLDTPMTISEGWNDILFGHNSSTSDSDNNNLYWAKLPSSLRSFETKTSRWSESDILALPSGLTHLQIRSPVRCMTAAAAAALPRTLTSLGPECNAPLDPLEPVLKALPRSLTTMPNWCSVWTPGLLEALPPHMSIPMILERSELLPLVPSRTPILTLSYFNESNASMLPRHLSSLQVSRTLLMPSMLQQLPISVSELYLQQAVLMTDINACIEAFPRHLVSLHWTLHSAQELKWPLELSLLPPDLTSLSMDALGSTLEDESITGLLFLRNLQRLALSSPKLTSLHLIHLPPTLTALNTVICGNLNADHMCTLPKHLLHLSVTILGEGISGLTNITLKLLPRDLLTLHLPASPHLTGWGLSELPPYLASFTLDGKTPDWFSFKR